MIKRLLVILFCIIGISSVYAKSEEEIMRCVNYYQGLAGWSGGDYSASINACYDNYTDDAERENRIRNCIRYYESLANWSGSNYSASINACYEIR